jgi:hypothetical protein
MLLPLFKKREGGNGRLADVGGEYKKYGNKLFSLLKR